MDWTSQGEIEPVKEIQADVLAIDNKLKTRTEAIIERGGDIQNVFDTLEEEQALMEEKGLSGQAQAEQDQDQDQGQEQEEDQDQEEGQAEDDNA